MSPNAAHALLTPALGFAIGLLWLRAFWSQPDRAPVSILAAPVLVAFLGLGHWVGYEFALGHWAGDFSLVQAVFNIAVSAALLVRRGRLEVGQTAHGRG